MDETNNTSNGCKHYLRKCEIISPCCQKKYWCRLCHDEENDDNMIDEKSKHRINRFEINQVECCNCHKIQSIKQYCEYCQTCFGLYYCDICHLFDDQDKKQFHCNGCGFCRIGKDNFIHCDKCNMCINKEIYDTHKCINVKDNVCSICMADMFTSTIPIYQLKCGHYLHTTCLTEMLHSSYKCPLCFQSIVDTDLLNQYIDQEISLTPMPDDYKDLMIKILCNDCHKESETKFHIFGLKCQHCQGYNSRRI